MTLVQPVRVTGCQHQAAQPAEPRIVDDRPDQAAADSPPPLRLVDEHVAHPAERRVIRDDTSERDLSAVPVGAEAERVGDRGLDLPARPPERPVGALGQRSVDPVDIEVAWIRTDADAVVGAGVLIDQLSKPRIS